MDNFTLASIMHEEEDPKSITDALSRQNGQECPESLQSELQSMKNHHVWDLVPRKSVPIGKKVIKSKTICHIKRDENGHNAKLKTRIVAKGFTQVAGEDYHDMFSPVARLESLRLILAIAAKLDWELRQLNVKTAFLHVELDEEIYMEQPEGGIVKGYEDHVCKLHKGIYRLKQAGRQWNKTLDKAMLKHGFNHISADHCVYMRSTSQGKSMIAVHTNDMAVAASTIPERDSILRDLRSMLT
jgi:Reverse transcriptase (RNA-dependent DNA polymerase)